MSIWNGPPIPSKGNPFVMPQEPQFLFKKLSKKQFRAMLIEQFPNRLIEPIFLENRFEPGSLIMLSERTGLHVPFANLPLEKAPTILIDKEYGIACNLGNELLTGLVDKSKDVRLLQDMPYLFLKQEFFLGIRADILGLQLTEHVIDAINRTKVLFTTIHLLTEDKIVVIEHRVVADEILTIIGSIYKAAMQKRTFGPYR